MPQQVILLHVDAPPKPAAGAPCNGCGVCCAAEPCPVGVLVSRRRHGACAALAWHEAERRYRCGLVTAPQTYLPVLPAAWTRRLALRWISAASGCDCRLEPAAAR